LYAVCLGCTTVEAQVFWEMRHVLEATPDTTSG
jgi:hypothetical protein